ncbi:unnamed protein product [Lactuca saligna]|uniref:Uncharacterized protein n=1 Tax=Lactuca saligna TaxID=75948 RepID=A0AA35Z1E2_LACSI|nr:unnamed protein product [Lactuca saligna]
MRGEDEVFTCEDAAAKLSLPSTIDQRCSPSQPLTPSPTSVNHHRLKTTSPRSTNHQTVTHIPQTPSPAENKHCHRRASTAINEDNHRTPLSNCRPTSHDHFREPLPLNSDFMFDRFEFEGYSLHSGMK